VAVELGPAELARHRLEAAEERFASAKILAAGSLYEDAVSRVYYAVSEAAWVALVALGVEEPPVCTWRISTLPSSIAVTAIYFTSVHRGPVAPGRGRGIQPERGKTSARRSLRPEYHIAAKYQHGGADSPGLFACNALPDM